MKFIKDSKDTKPLVDNVFTVVKKAEEAKLKYGEDKIIDATIGSLADDNGLLVALDTVYNSYRNLKNQDYTRYAEFIVGNQDYLKAMEKWIFNKVKITLPHKLIATPGGTGGLSATICNILNPSQILLVPDIGWSSYHVMGKENNLIVSEYSMFNDNNEFDMESIQTLVCESIKKQGKAVIIINSPCHNPTGFSLSYEQWKQFFTFLNEQAKEGEVILINDVAYIDYAFDLEEVKRYMNLFNEINNNILIALAYSCSKAFTSYGMRCGCLCIINPLQENVNALYNVIEYSCRALWSNVNNGAMMNVTNILNNHQEAYLKEKDKYITLLKQRSSLFIKEAKENDLDIYPFIEGFFVTLKMDNKKRDIIHQRLMENNIFTIKVNKGIRIGICSVNEKKIKGLAAKIKRNSEV